MAHAHDVVDASAPRPAARPHAPSIAPDRVTLAAHAATPASLLRLQRLAGNVAVQRAVGADEAAPAVQRARRRLRPRLVPLRRRRRRPDPQLRPAAATPSATAPAR